MKASSPVTQPAIREVDAFYTGLSFRFKEIGETAGSPSRAATGLMRFSRTGSHLIFGLSRKDIR
jgi:hypothetical protein